MDNKPVVFIGTPVYKMGEDTVNGQVFKIAGHPRFALCIEAVVGEHEEYEAHFHVVVGDADINRARARLLNTYLKREKPWTHFLMVDSDIEFHPSSIPHMLKRSVSCVGGGYAFKCATGYKAGRAVVRAWPEGSDKDKWANEVAEARNDGMMPCKYLGGGHALVTDALIRSLCEAFPDLKYEFDMDASKDGSDPGTTYALWRALFVEKPERPGKMEMLSEDWSFFERVNSIGHICWWDRAIDLAHWDGDDVYLVGSGLNKAREVNSTDEEWGLLMRSLNTMRRGAAGSLNGVSPSMAPHLDYVLAGEYAIPLNGGGYRILDAGANVGSFSVWASMIWPGSEVVAVEPHPINFDALQKNVSGLNVQTVNKALGSFEGEVFIVNGTNNSGEARTNQIAGDYQVKQINAAKLGQFHIVKIDTEGGELPILNSLDLSKTVAVMLEYHSVGDAIEIEKLLTGKGFIKIAEAITQPGSGTGVQKYMRFKDGGDDA